MKEQFGAVLVVGGGIVGMQASLDLAESGFRVHLLENQTSIGGRMAQLDKTFPTNDCAMCIMAPKLVDTGRHPNIELITNSELKNVEGEAGHFKVNLAKRPYYVNPAKCTGCGDCERRCPVEAIDSYNEGLSKRGAISINYVQAIPRIYAIDREKCIGCGICKEICKAGAVEYDQTEERLELNVGSIILATGGDLFDPSGRKEYGYGVYPNVVSSIQFERLLSATGPHTGHIIRPFDGEVPRRIAFIECVGSRDAKSGNTWCSSICCVYTAKEAMIAKEHEQGLECHVFYMDVRAFGKGFQDYVDRAKSEYGVKYTKCRVSSVRELPTRNLVVSYEEGDVIREEEFDMVVLAVGIQPPKDLNRLAEILGVELNEYGFPKTSVFSPLETSRPGIYVCGLLSEPKDIPDSVAQASGAAAKASGIISTERGKLTVVKEYPEEKEVLGEEPRIGVFVCHCGINIGGVVDVPDVVEYAKTLPNVVYAEHNLFTCSQDTQEAISEKIKQHDLNRIVVASCTPHTHEKLFRDTIRSAELNPYLFELANIRNHCSWVHAHDPRKATKKARDLVRSSVARVRLLDPLRPSIVEMRQQALVIGGGLSGMVAALEVAKQGYEAYLVEKQNELGGNLRHIYYALRDEDPQGRLKSIVGEVKENSLIHTYTSAELNSVSGHLGDFVTTIMQNGDEKELRHGVIIVATGASEYQPKEYLYGEDEHVVTQVELEDRLAHNKFEASNVVMIQCVGCRNDERRYCSRICCSVAAKNALKVKEVSPDTDVFVLYRDIRTYGFREDYYTEAAKKGVIFIQYDDENKPRVVKEDGRITVLIRDRVARSDLQIEPDLVALSAAVIPNPDNESLAKILKLPLSKDGFFMEAHTKLRPIDFASEGIFLCGLAHYPKFIDESMSQACGAVSRACTFLSKEKVEIEPLVSEVDKSLCTGCGTCEFICPYDAIEVREEDGRLFAVVNVALCKGCGTCNAACPSSAVTVNHFNDKQITAQIEVLTVR